MKKVKNYYTINMNGEKDIDGYAMLLPCPFCGEKFSIELQNTYTPSCWVECHNCGAQAHGKPFDAETIIREHFEMAIESAEDHWNRRSE